MDLKTVAALADKKKKKVIGLMSGTSLDGVDAVLAEIKRNGKSTKIRQLEFITFPFPKDLKRNFSKTPRLTAETLPKFADLIF